MKTVGVVDGMSLHSETSPKRELLYFDELAVTRLEHLIDWNRTHIHGEYEWARELEWLHEQGLLLDPLKSYAPGLQSGSRLDEDFMQAVSHSTARDELFRRMMEIALVEGTTKQQYASPQWK